MCVCRKISSCSSHTATLFLHVIGGKFWWTSDAATQPGDNLPAPTDRIRIFRCYWGCSPLPQLAGVARTRPYTVHVNASWHICGMLGRAGTVDRKQVHRTRRGLCVTPLRYSLMLPGSGLDLAIMRWESGRTNKKSHTKGWVLTGLSECIPIVARSGNWRMITDRMWIVQPQLLHRLWWAGDGSGLVWRH